MPFPWQSHHWQHLQGDTFPSHLTKILWGFYWLQYVSDKTWKLVVANMKPWDEAHVILKARVKFQFPLCVGYFYWIESGGASSSFTPIFIFSKEDNLQCKHPTHNLILWYLGNSLEVDNNVMTSWFEDLKFYHLWRCDK